jgi:Flp pilus assembly pilin Flp
MREICRRFLTDEAAQDLVEYALLSAFIGLAGAAAFGILANTLGTAYGNWNVGVQGLWEPPNPAAPTP